MNLPKLKGMLVEKELKKSELAKSMGISVQALGKKLNGTTKITTDDAEKMCLFLKIDSYTERAEIFLP